MVWGVTLRSPHPRARIRSIDIGAALATAGVTAVLTHEDVPGSKFYGLEILDQPVLAIDEVRYTGEPVAIVAADHPETARRAAAKIVVEYDVLDPITDNRAAMSPDSPLVHATPTQDHYPGGGNILRHVLIRRGDADAAADVVVTGEYEVGMQDQAFLGPESGLAVPADDGGIDLYIATQWLHVDQHQVAASLGLPEDKVRCRRGVRRARGRLDADPRLPAGAAHEQAGEDGLFARGVLLRARAPAPGDDALRARREP
jgi:CO/xanthine dehydrogenase Mo-binding subunit